MKSIDLFAGAGGMTTGAEQGGMRVVWAANHWDRAVQIHKLNHPECVTVQQDLQQANFGAVLWDAEVDCIDAIFAGPSSQCEGRILVAHKGSSMPAAAAEGTADTDWKRVYTIGGGIANSASTRGVFRFGPEVAYLEVEFDGNATQAVTVEAHATTYTY